MEEEQKRVYTEEEVERYAQEQEALRKATDHSFVLKCIACFCIIVFLYFLGTTSMWSRRSAKKMERTRAISHAKQVYLVMMDFEADYGSFPDDRTAAKDPALTIFTGTHSNDYLGQLIAGGYTKSEELFYSYDARYSRRKPDGVISPDANILGKGECGFSYVMAEDKGIRRGLSTKDTADLPILAAPLVNEWGSCDKKSFEGRGMYLRIDGSARIERLRSSDQKIRLMGGLTLFDTTSGSAWGALTPVVLLPER